MVNEDRPAGNQGDDGGPGGDDGGGCWQARVAVSAALDGEEGGQTQAETNAHLHGCGECRAWAERARVRVAELLPPAPSETVTTLRHGIADPLVAVAAMGAPVGAAKAVRRRPGRLGRTAAIAASVVVVAAGVGIAAAKLVQRHSSGGGGGIASTQQVAGSSQSDPRSPGATVLPVAIPKPDLVLTDTSGRPFDLATRTAGKVTLIYFGYTHCPDVCPINMALAAQALAKMPAAQARAVDVVFVTTDPARDSPAVVRSWLANFSSSFIGLTGSIAAVERAEQEVGMARSEAVPGGPAADGGYQVIHSGFTLVYDQGGTSRMQFFDTARPAQYATTLEHLVTKGFQA